MHVCTAAQMVLQHGGDPAARPDSLSSLRGATEQLRLSIVAEEWQLGASEAVSMSARGVDVCVCVCVCVCVSVCVCVCPWSRPLQQRSPQGSAIAPFSLRA